MKTVELIPTWSAALNMVTALFQDSRSHLRTAKHQRLMDERIEVMRAVFGPLCEAADKRNEEIRAAKGSEFLDCGHTSADLNADMKCSVCGCDSNVPF
jgi:hypothetical protein